MTQQRPIAQGKQEAKIREEQAPEMIHQASIVIMRSSRPRAHNANSVAFIS
jgi:hypothetical protein